MEPLPYLTAELPGVGGEIKARPEDFRVEEIPAEKPSGRGRHAWFRVTKKGVTTQGAIVRIARYMGAPPATVGFAGLKDAQAITVQWMSLEYAEAGRLARFKDEQIKVSSVTWHSHGLKTGHLLGNRFGIRLRGVGAAQLPRAQAVLAVLARRGCPNYFGPQRFGSRGDTGLLGEALVHGDRKGFLDIFLGRPLEGDPPECRQARRAFDLGRMDEALRRWPRHYVEQRKALTAYSRKLSAEAALATLDRRAMKFFVYAFQSEIFNRVLAGRIDRLDVVEAGDILQRADNGEMRLVADPAAEMHWLERFQTHPTGPIVGARPVFAEGAPGRWEREVLRSLDVKPADFARMERLSGTGSRRTLRYAMGEPKLSAGADRHGEYLQIEFTAPSGCYATSALREITKTAIAAADE